MPPSLRNSDGFSLIELLVVVAIIGVLAAFAVPAFNSIGSAQGVTEAAYSVSSMLELARTEAVNRNTYTWAGIEPVTDGGSLAVRIGLGYSKDGTTNTNAGNFQPVSRALLLKGVTLTNFASLKPETLAVLAGPPITADLANNSAGVAFKIGSTSFSASRTVTFTPRGEAMLTAAPGSTNGFDPLIGIAFKQVRGAAVPTNAQDVGIVLDGSVGIPRILRIP